MNRTKFVFDFFLMIRRSVLAEKGRSEEQQTGKSCDVCRTGTSAAPVILNAFLSESSVGRRREVASMRSNARRGMKISDESNSRDASVYGQQKRQQDKQVLVLNMDKYRDRKNQKPTPRKRRERMLSVVLERA